VHRGRRFGVRVRPLLVLVDILRVASIGVGDLLVARLVGGGLLVVVVVVLVLATALLLAVAVLLHLEELADGKADLLQVVVAIFEQPN